MYVICLAWNQKVGGPLVTIVPQQALWQMHKVWARNFLHTLIYTVTASITATNIGNVRNWHSTHSCAHVAIAVRWPWQLWCTQSLHSVSIACGASWIWSDDKASIGRNTANKKNADICLRVSFIATNQENTPCVVALCIQTWKCSLYIQRQAYSPSPYI